MQGGPDQGHRIWVPGGEMLMRSSATTAEGHGQTPQGFSGLSSLVRGFYKVPVASDIGLEGSPKTTDLAWTCSERSLCCFWKPWLRKPGRRPVSSLSLHT